MASRSTLTENLAIAILDSRGIDAIWQLRLDAAYAYQTGYPVAAEAILKFAEAAERELMGRPTSSVHIANWLH
jgi:hypothetical protein